MVPSSDQSSTRLPDWPRLVLENDRYREALETIRDRRPLWDEERALWGAWCAEIAREALGQSSEQSTNAPASAATNQEERR